MIKFINNIENLLPDLIHHNNSIIFFYLENCQISLSIYDTINNYDYDLHNNIIFINKTSFLKNNISKFINNSLNNYIFSLYPNLKNVFNLGSLICLILANFTLGSLILFALIFLIVTLPGFLADTFLVFVILDF